MNTVWLLPFYPSPARDDGYDISEYHAVIPTYGDLRQFKALHPRGACARHRA